MKDAFLHIAPTPRYATFAPYPYKHQTPKIAWLLGPLASLAAGGAAGVAAASPPRCRRVAAALPLAAEPRRSP
ncbi:MAG TPA: hypothetical protein P5169_09690 [Kiritimatiellia bacterium]|nr:hypothetical protein [Kiritimatiellia bacterium]